MQHVNRSEYNDPMFQFSLRTLIIAVTVLSVALGWWFSRPPVLSPAGTSTGGISNYSDSSTPHCVAIYQQQAWNLSTPYGPRRAVLNLAFVSLRQRGDQWVWFQESGEEAWMPEVGFAVGFPSADGESLVDKVRATVVYDAHENTVSLGATSLNFSSDPST